MNVCSGEMKGRRSGNSTFVGVTNEQVFMAIKRQLRSADRRGWALQFDDVPERCACVAGLWLNFAPFGTHLAKAALHAALDDMAASVQASVEIAARLCQHDSGKSGAECSVNCVCGSGRIVATGGPARTRFAGQTRCFRSPPHRKFLMNGSLLKGAPGGSRTKQERGRQRSRWILASPRLTLVPWWLFARWCRIVPFVESTWLVACGVSSWKWVMAMMVTVAGFFLAFGHATKPLAMFPIRSRGSASVCSVRFRRLARAPLASCSCFPTADVLVDNASGVDVRLFIDDEEWLDDFNRRFETENQLSQGKASRHGSATERCNRVSLTPTTSTSAGYGPYVFNVLGDQGLLKRARCYIRLRVAART